VKITALEVDGYGVWTGLKLAGLSDGLSVFYGPNEAGKTTLMQFLRSVLYGFANERRRYLPPLRGGSPGGSLYVAGPQGEYQVSRHQSPQHANDELVSLLAADGTRQGEHLLKTLLYGVDEKTFNNVFAVGLHELQELATLSDTEAAAQLYNLSIGLDRVSLVEVVGELEASRRRLLDPDGRPCQLVQLLGRRERLREEIQSLSVATHRYASLVAEHKQAEREVSRLEAESTRLQGQLRTAETAIAVGDRWRRSAELARQLAALETARGIPAGAVRRLEAINGRLRQYQDRIERWKSQREQIRAEAASLPIHEALLRLAPRIEALGEQEEWIAGLHRRTAELETEIGSLENELRDQRTRLGLDAVEGGLPSLSTRQWNELKRPALQLRRAGQRLAEAEQQVAAAEESARKLGKQIEAGLAARGERDLAEAMARAGGLVAQLRKRLQLDERLEQMTRHQAELESQSRELLGRQLLPAWVLVGLGAVFVMGVLLLMAGLFMPDSLTGSLGWPLAVLGLVGTLAAVAAKSAIDHSNARQLDACRSQAGMLRAQIQQSKGDRRQLDEQLAGGSGPLEARLEAAEKVLAGLEELVPLDARRQAAEQEVETASLRAAEANNEASKAAARWRDVLRAAGLPVKLSPKQVRELASHGSRIGQLQRRLELHYEELQQRSRELEAIGSRIGQLAVDAGLPVEATDPIERLHALVARLAEQEGRLSRRQALRAQSRRLRRKLDKCDAATSRLKHFKRKLFRAAGVESEEHLRQAAEEAAEAAALGRQREALEREIDAAIGGHTTRQAVAAALDAHEQDPLESRLEQIRKRCQAVEAGLRQQFEKRGRLAEQLKTLADDRTPAAKQLELGMVQQRLNEAVRSWRRLAVTGRILGQIRETYERQRQPQALQDASAYLENLTQGRYVRVWTPLDRQVLLVEDSQGESLPVEVLSQGTREQLFVCLRLAMAAGYANRGAPLPLILDDVLVNFDSRRAKTAAALLRDFAAGHQLLVFTCHEHIVKLFKSLRVDVLTLPDNSETGVTLAVSQAAAKTRRKPKPQVAPGPPARRQPAAATIEPPEPDDEEEELPEWADELEPWEEEPEEEDDDLLEEEVEEEDEEPEEEYEEYEEDVDEEPVEVEVTADGQDDDELDEEDYEEDVEADDQADDEEDIEDDYDYDDEEEEVDGEDDCEADADEYDEEESDDFLEQGEDRADGGMNRQDGWDDRYEDEYDRDGDEADDDRFDDAEAA